MVECNWCNKWNWLSRVECAGLNGTCEIDQDGRGRVGWVR